MVIFKGIVNATFSDGFISYIIQPLTKQIIKSNEYKNSNGKHK